jgi:hypothetical protein
VDQLVEKHLNEFRSHTELSLHIDIKELKISLFSKAEEVISLKKQLAKLEFAFAKQTKDLDKAVLELMHEKKKCDELKT